MTKQSRIPIALQVVFLASNRGEEVHAPPPGNIAFRMFKSIFQNQGSSKKLDPRTHPTAANGFLGRRKQQRSSRTYSSQLHPSASTDELDDPFHDVHQNVPVNDIQRQFQSPTRSRQTLTTSRSPIMSRQTLDVTRGDYWKRKSLMEEWNVNDDNSSASTVTCTVADRSTSPEPKVSANTVRSSTSCLK
jgi:hypothetical protein